MARKSFCFRRSKSDGWTRYLYYNPEFRADVVFMHDPEGTVELKIKEYKPDYVLIDHDGEENSITKIGLKPFKDKETGGYKYYYDVVPYKEGHKKAHYAPIRKIYACNPPPTK